MSGGGNEAAGRPDGAVERGGGTPVAHGIEQPLRRRTNSILHPLATAFAATLADERPRFVNWLPVLFGLGIWAYFALSAEPSLAAAALPLVTGLVLVGMTRADGTARIAAAALVIAALGFAAAKIRTDWVAAPVLDRPLRAVELTGVLERREPHAKRGERLTLRLIAMKDVEPARLPARARIRVMSPAGDIAPGDILKMTASVSPPSIPALPGGYDFARTAYFDRIGAVGYALKPPEKVTLSNQPQPDTTLRLRSAVENLRQTIGRRIEAALPGERGALAAALITGERGGISEATTDAYRDSGLVHILSISGLHMVIMAGAVFAILRFGLATIPALALTQPIKKWAAAGGAIGALCYFAISGGSAATLRATIMMVVFFLAVMLGRPAIAMRNVALAALLILALAPNSLLDVGFQMSFAAVAALVAAYEAIRGRMDRYGLTPGPAMRGALFLGGILFSTLIAGLAVTPLSVYHFHAMQHYAPLANLIAVPVCNLVVMPAALATLIALPFGLEAAPLWIMGHGIDAMGWVARHVAALPGAVTHIPAIPSAAFAMVLAGGFWLVLWQRRWRLAGLPLIALGFVWAPATTKPDILIGREGAIVAVRDAQGRLAAHAERPSSFELKRWLERDGDQRDPKELRKSTIFRCDPTGCVTETSGATIAVSRHPASLADDCARAKILIVTGERPAACDAPLQIYDRKLLRQTGTVALTRQPDGSFSRLTVADARGLRPWSTPPQPRPAPDQKSPAAPIPTAGTSQYPATPLAIAPNVSRYAAPKPVAEAFAENPELRPEVEDDGP